MNKKPYYKESAKILAFVKKSKRILVSFHRNPDVDSIGSIATFYEILKKMNKEVGLIGPDDIPRYLFFLKHVTEAKRADLSRFDFSSWNLLIIPDTANYVQFYGNLEKRSLPKIPTIVLDHHKTSLLKGDITLLDRERSSCTEIIWRLCEDWGISLSKDVATSLLAGIIGDTYSFRFVRNALSYDVAKSLVEKGANESHIVKRLYYHYDLPVLKSVGSILQKMKAEYGFVWSIIPHSEFRKRGGCIEAKEIVSDNFLPSVASSEFGFLLVEKQKDFFSLSVRSSGSFNCIKFVKPFCGGGHKNAAGALLYGSQKEVTERVLSRARKMIK